MKAYLVYFQIAEQMDNTKNSNITQNALKQNLALLPRSRLV